MHLTRKEHSFRYLLIRALLVLILVTAGLLLLRRSGLTGWEKDLPMEAVEQTAEAQSTAAAPAAEAPT